MTEQGPQPAVSGKPGPEAQRVAGLVMVRIATGGGAEDDVARDLGPFLATRAGGDVWRVEVGRLVAALVAGGLVVRNGKELAATATGVAAAADLLHARKGLPSSWESARDLHLVALALGLAPASGARLKMLRKADGLRGLIVVGHWQLRIKGAPTASRLRSALARKALERAFGNQIGNGLGDKSQLPAKAGRLLAAQLLATERDHGTDGRLLAAFASEAVGARRGDLKSLRTAVIRRFLGREETEAAGRRRTRLKAGLGRKATKARSGAKSPDPTRQHVVAKVAGGADVSALAPNGETPRANQTPAAPIATERPGPQAFAAAVQAAANETAEGWPGNRRAFISRVWSVIAARYAAWALTEIEFKCMLTEAHRTGLVALVNADLKERSALGELQRSAVIYKNSVWHYVRAGE